MAIYDINFFQKIIEWLPPKKRKLLNILWLKSFMSPIVSMADKIFTDYRIGNIYPNWSAGTYNTGDKVIYATKIYECLVDGNTNVPTASGWREYLSSFVGVNERILFNGKKVVLEYALNTYYQTTFRQPNAVSDIYIGNVPKKVVGFVVGQTIGSLVSATDTGGKSEYNPFVSYNANDIVKYNGRMYVSLVNANTFNPDYDTKWQITETINYDLPFAYVFNFNINVPNALYLSVSPNIEREMRNIVDKIIPFSIKYSITPY